jgi:hypothetical protein
MPSDKSQPNPSKLSDKELLVRIRTRFQQMEEADHDNRQQAMEDMKFLHIPGYGWDAKSKKARGKRPCYEFPKLRIKTKRIVNEMRANRPSGKVRAVEEGDRPTARVLEGLGRNILSVSDFDTIADHAGEYQVGGGLAAWRILTDYSETDPFVQDICVKPIANPFNVYCDENSTDPLHRDAEDFCLLDRISNVAYERKYPKARKVDFDGDSFDDDVEWRDETSTRICEYHWKEPAERDVVKLQDGKIVYADDPQLNKIDPTQIIARKTMQCHKILMCVASGDAILEGPVELKGQYHRIILFHGEWMVIDGEVRWWGMTRHAKDAQRAYNVSSTSVTEAVATAPKSHFWATAEQAKGLTDQWNRAITENMPYLLYNPDPKAPGPPQMAPGAQIPAALVQELQIRDQELKDVTGVYDASLGERSNEKSGIAISRRTEQTQIVNFNFPDNMAKAKQWTVTVINDLIPYYYDTERTIRVIGVDGAEDYVRINTVGIGKDGLPAIVNDLTRGKYDVTVTVGPSFSTQRQEAAETYTQMAQQDPALMPTAGDLVYKSLDLPYAEEIAERRRAMLPAPIQQMIAQKGQQAPEVRAAMAQVSALQEQVNQQGKLVQQAAGEADQRKSEAEKAEAKVQTAIEQLRTEEARFEAIVAKAQAQLAQKEAQIAAREVQSQLEPAQKDIESQKQTLLVDAQNAIQGIQALAQQFMEAAQQTIQMIDQRAAQPAPARPRVARIKRVNGELIGTIDELNPDGSVAASRPVNVSRQNGEIVGTMQ